MFASNRGRDSVYNNGGLNGLRILALGESHYLKAGVSRESKEYSEVTRDDVRRVVAGKSESPFFPKVASLLRYASGKHFRDVEIWHRVAFYNYVQTFMESSAHRPTTKHFRQSSDAFLQVVATLEPHMILVLGATLWNHLPVKSEPVGRLKKHPFCLQTKSQIWPYGSAVAGYINHPSQPGWRFERWAPACHELFEFCIMK